MWYSAVASDNSKSQQQLSRRLFGWNRPIAVTEGSQPNGRYAAVTVMAANGPTQADWSQVTAELGTRCRRECQLQEHYCLLT